MATSIKSVHLCEGCPVFTEVPKGQFVMEGPLSRPTKNALESNYAPQITVEFSNAFFMSKHKVTNSDWAACVDAGECRSSQRPLYQLKMLEAFENLTEVPNNKKWFHSELRRWREETYPNVPLLGLSVEQARIYAEWISKKSGRTCHLPTEAQLEYVAMAPRKTSFVCKSNFMFGKCQDNFNNHFWSKEFEAPIGTHHITSTLGVYDLYTGAHELTDSCYTTELVSTLVNSSGELCREGYSIRDTSLQIHDRKSYWTALRRISSKVNESEKKSELERKQNILNNVTFRLVCESDL